MSSLLTCSLLISNAISPASNAFAESQNRPDNIQNKKNYDTLAICEDNRSLMVNNLLREII